jgi:hypothetical protein
VPFDVRDATFERPVDLELECVDAQPGSITVTSPLADGRLRPRSPLPARDPIGQRRGIVLGRTTQRLLGLRHTRASLLSLARQPVDLVGEPV